MRESTGGPAGLAACIFDLDGTLVDSEPLYFASEAVFLAPWGIRYDEALNEEMVGRGVEHFFRVLAERFPESPFNALALEERMRLKEADHLAYCEGRLRPFASMAALVPELSRRGVPMAVASGSSPAVIAHSLRAAGLERHFPVVLSASEVPRGKPAPDIFLEAARRLGVEPGACLVFEDARPGIEAARAAGMRCVAFPPAGHPARFPEAYAGLAACVEGGPDALTASELLALVEGLGLPGARR